MCKLEVNTVL